MPRLHKTIFEAVLKLFKPLAKILLRHGISYAESTELLKMAYVDVADQEFTIKGRKQTTSRISVLTGLHRKEVSRIKEKLTTDYLTVEPLNRATRVVGGWLSDRNYSDAESNPFPLSLEGKDKSFASLVKKYSGDMTARAVLDELYRAGTVQVSEGNTVTLSNQSYVPAQSDEQLLEIFGICSQDLLNTLEHNLSSDSKDTRLQLTVAYDNLSPEVVKKFKSLSNKESQKLLNHLNNWLAKHDHDHLDKKKLGKQSGKMIRAGLGIYYFEDKIFQENDDEK